MDSPLHKEVYGDTQEHRASDQESSSADEDGLGRTELAERHPPPVQDESRFRLAAP